MNKKTKISLLILLFLATLVLIYILFIDFKSQVPETISEKYDIKIEEYSKRKVFTISPKQNKTNQYILYFHGGAYMGEITENHWNFLNKIIEETNATIILPDYPLAPKNNYKDVFEMVEPLYEDILKSTQNLIVMGDSAGGGIALALAEKLGEEGKQQPNQLILLSPWLDVTMSNPEIEKIQEKDKKLNKETLKVAGITYAGLDGMGSYLVNPINGPVENLKNVTIFTGTNDILNPDVHLLKSRAENIEIKEYEGASHIWMIDENNEISQKATKDLTNLIKNIDK